MQSPNDAIYTDEEEWRDVPGFVGSYQVSNHGRVKSLARKISDGRFIQGRNLVLLEVVLGYHSVHLSLNGRAKQHFVHRLVAFAFIGDPQGRDVNHIDFNTRNNHPTNLEYCTHAENMKHSARHGRFPRNEAKSRKLTNEQALEIRNLGEQKVPPQLIADKFGVSRRTIRCILSGKTWRYLEKKTPESELTSAS